jgi:hypothetical protein
VSQPRPRFLAENAVLISATRVDRRPDRSEASAGLDWSYLRKAADCQGVTPLLYAWLLEHPRLTPDRPFLEALHETYWSGHFRNRLLLGELERIARVASARGIDLMPLKGARLAPHFYPTPALRPLSDLDLLVRPADVDRFGSVLRSMGYAEVDHAPSYVDDERLDMDSRDYCWFQSHLGFDALIEYRVAPLELAVGRLTDLDPAYTDGLRRHADEVWARATTGSGDPLKRQSAEDLLLHVTTHMAAKHVHFRLIWLHDVARIVAGAPELDWVYLAERSHHLRMAAPVAAALEGARAYAGAAVSDRQIAEITARLGTASRWSLAHRDLARLRQHLETMPSRDLSIEGPALWPLGAALSRVTGWRARLRVLRWVLLPGRGYLAHRGLETSGLSSRVLASARRLANRLSRAR